MNYFMTDRPLAFLEEGGRVHWEDWGFSVAEVSRAVAQGFQQQEGERMVSLLPIADEALLLRRLEATAAGEGGLCRVISEEEAVAERDRLQAGNAALTARRAALPTDEDVFRAQQLLLLTKINRRLEGASNA